MSDKEKLEKRRKEHMEDLDLFSRFQKAAVNRLDSMANMAQDSDTTWQMGESERELVRQLNGMGVKEGLVATVATFVLLRRGPILLSRYLHHRQTIRMQQQQQQMRNMGSTPPPPPPPPPSSGSSFQLSKPPNVGSSNNPFQQSNLPTGAQQHQYEWQNPRPRSIIFRTAWFCIDVTVSLLAGASVSIAYTDTDKIRRQVVEMPLLEGRSLVADAFCDPIELELNKLRQEGHPSYLRLMKQRQQEQETFSSSSASVLEVVPSDGRRYSQRGDDDSDDGTTPVGPYLQDILTAVEHCQRRRHVEHEIRIDHGWNKSHPVEIPSPGVPRDGPRMALENDEDKSSDTTAPSSSDDFDNSSTSDFDDPTQFVTDQEEQMRNDTNGAKDSDKKGWW